jgi:uncharacterized protein (TIGR00369 family)
MTASDSAAPTRRAIVADFVPHSPLVRRLGIRLDRIEPDLVELVLPFDPENATMGDVVHGGAIAALVDTAGMAAAWADDEVPDAVAGATVSMSVDYVAAAHGADLRARAEVVRRGRSLCFVEVTVRDRDGEGDVVAKGLVTHRFG